MEDAEAVEKEETISMEVAMISSAEELAALEEDQALACDKKFRRKLRFY